jgi:hypothetical protein
MDQHQAEELKKRIETEVPNCKVVQMSGADSFRTLQLLCTRKDKGGTTGYLINGQSDWENWLRNWSRDYK